MPLRRGARGDSSARPGVSVAAVAEHVRVSCALPSAGPTVGAEVEWLVADRADPSARPTVDQVERLLARLELPGGSRISFEPGGQLELSSVPTRTPEEAWSGLQADLAVVRPALRAGGLDLLAAAHHPSRPPVRVSQSRRYAAMERWFAAGGWTTAPEMMCNTASIQVNVGCGPDPSAQWQLANELAPTLAAMFACSPGEGWASTRLRVWSELDPSRTSTALASGDAISDWTDYALSADAIMRARDDGAFEPLPRRLTLREWIESGDHLDPPTSPDLDLHLSTLFPPVRLKGWIEIRVIDMQPGDWWPVPLAVAAALLDPSAGGDRHTDFAWLSEVIDIGWQEAGRMGLSSFRLASASDSALGLAHRRLDEQGSALAPLVERFRAERVAPHLVPSQTGDARP